jgi:hypothetical protein
VVLREGTPRGGTLPRMTNIRSLLDVSLAINAITLVLSLGIAELLYKFHSFTLEAIAFLATWYVLRRIVLFAASPAGRVDR